MKTANVSLLRTQFPLIQEWLEAGEQVLITKRNVVVAELTLPKARKRPDFKKRFSLKGWKPPKKTIEAVQTSSILAARDLR